MQTITPVIYRRHHPNSWPAILLIPLFILLSLIGYGITRQPNIFDDSVVQISHGQALQFGVGGGPPLVITPTTDTSATGSPVPHDVF